MSAHVGVGDLVDNGRRTMTDEEARAHVRAHWEAVAAYVRALPTVRYTDRQDEPWPVVGRCVP